LNKCDFEGFVQNESLSCADQLYDHLTVER